MSVHEQYADDLALYALDALPGDERAALEKHLRECADCRRELELLRGDASLLALSIDQSSPPRKSRQRLMDAVKRESHKKSLPLPSRSVRSWWAPVPWIAALAMAILAILQMRQNSRQQQEISQLQNRSSKQRTQLERAREVVATLTDPNAVRVTLVAATAPPQPQGKVMYVRNRASLILVASNLQALPPQKAYELWLIPVKGNPVPAGTFKPDSHGSGVLINPAIPPGLTAKAFAITVEPEAGSAAPTLPILLQGAGE